MWLNNLDQLFTEEQVKTQEMLLKQVDLGLKSKVQIFEFELLSQVFVFVVFRDISKEDALFTRV